MTHVIGLFARDLDYNRSIAELQTAGLNPEKIELMSREQVVGDVLGCGSARIVAIYAGIGALLGVLIYGISALLANWCQGNLFHFGQIIQIGTLIGGVLSGMLVGGSLGVFLGIGKLEEVTTIYRQAKCLDGKVLDVKVTGEQAGHIKNVLQRDGAYKVKIL